MNPIEQLKRIKAALENVPDENFNQNNLGFSIHRGQIIKLGCGCVIHHSLDVFFPKLGTNPEPLTTHQMIYDGDLRTIDMPTDYKMFIFANRAGIKASDVAREVGIYGYGTHTATDAIQRIDLVILKLRAK